MAHRHQTSLQTCPHTVEITPSQILVRALFGELNLRTVLQRSRRNRRNKLLRVVRSIHIKTLWLVVRLEKRVMAHFKAAQPRDITFTQKPCFKRSCNTNGMQFYRPCYRSTINLYLHSIAIDCGYCVMIDQSKHNTVISLPTENSKSHQLGHMQNTCPIHVIPYSITSLREYNMLYTCLHWIHYVDSQLGH